MHRLFGLGSLHISHGECRRLFARWVGAVWAALLMALGGHAMAAPMISTFETSTSAVKSDGSRWAWGGTTYSVYLPEGHSFVPIQRGTGFDSFVLDNYNNAAIMADGSLWISGDNSFGQLGNGTINIPPTSTVPLLIGPGFKSVSIGYVNIFAIKTDGSLWAWGYNREGDLGDGGTTDVSSPKQIGSDFAQVESSYGRTYAIKNNGDLWGWGLADRDGGLGHGAHGYVLTPLLLGSGYANIALGPDFTLAIKTDGTLWGWGDNYFGQLGDGTTTDAFTPKQIGTGFAKVSAGVNYALGIKTDGSLWAWGWNHTGQLGDGTTTDALSPKQIGTGFTDVAANIQHSVAIKADGSLWVWGRNWNGALGMGTNDNLLALTPTQLFPSGFASVLSVTTTQPAVSSPQLISAQLKLTNDTSNALTFTPYLLEKDGVQYAPEPEDSAAASYAPPVDNTVKVSLAPVTLAASETRLIEVPLVIARPDLLDPLVATPMSVDFGVTTSDSRDIKASLALSVSPRSEPAPASALQLRLRTGPVADLGAAAAAAADPTLSGFGGAQPTASAVPALPSADGDYWNLWILVEMDKKPKGDEDRKFYFKLRRFGLSPRDAYAVLYLRAISQLKPEKADKTSWFKLAKGSAQLWAEVKKGQWGLTPDFATPARTIFEGIDSVNALYFLNILELSTSFSAPLVSAMQDNFTAYITKYTQISEGLCEYVQGGLVKNLPFPRMIEADIAYYMTSNGRWHPKIHNVLFDRIQVRDKFGEFQTLSYILQKFMDDYLSGNDVCANNVPQRRWVRIDVHSPLLPLVTDSQGRRFGIDAQGTLHDEIPQSYIDPGHPWSMAVPALDGALTIDYALAYPYDYGIEVRGLLDGVETSKHTTQGTAGAGFSLKQQAVVTNTPQGVIIKFPASQTITPGPAPSVKVGQTGTVTATASSGLPVSFSITPSNGVCSLAGAVVTGISQGICTVYADQAGDANYAPAPRSNIAFSVLPANVTAPTPPTITSITAGPGRATINFTAPTNTGGAPIASYTASCAATGQTTKTATGSGSPITVTGLKSGVAYSCSLTAFNGAYSSASSASTTVTPDKSSDITPILMLLLD